MVIVKTEMKPTYLKTICSLIMTNDKVGPDKENVKTKWF
jgi:hypothetical protein